MNTDQARSIDLHLEANPARLTLLLLAVVALIIFLVGVGDLAFVDPDEGQYALISWNMVHSGQWLVPMLDQQPYLDKPPLFFWLTAISFKLLGPSEFAARIVPAVGAALTIVVCYLLAGQLYGGNCAILSACCLLSSIGAIGMGKFLGMDIFLTALIGLAIWAFIKGYKSGLASSWFLLMYVAGALAMLTKGPIGLLIPAAVIGIFLTINRQWSRLGQMQGIIGLAIIILLAGWWFVYMAVVCPGYLEEFFLRHNLQRLGGAALGYPESPLIYPAILILGFLPWSPLLVPAVAGSIVDGFGRQWRWQDQMLIIWVGFVVLFFSLSSTRLINYVMPAFLPLAVILGKYAQQYLDADLPMRRARRTLRLAYPCLLASCVIVIFMLAFSIALLIALRVHSGWDGLGDVFADSWRGRWGYLLSIACRLGVIAVMIKILWACRDRRMVQSMAVACGVATVLLAIAISYDEMPRIADKFSMKRLAPMIVQHSEQGDPILVGSGDYWSISFYLMGSRQVRHLDNASQFGDYVKYPGNFIYIATDDNAYNQVRWILKDRVHRLARSGQNRLLLIKPLPTTSASPQRLDL